MNKNKFILNWLVVLALCLSALVIAPLTSAATLEFSPATGSYSTNSPFNVEIKVDTQNQDTQSTDAVIEFDTSFLSVDNVTYGSFYPTVLHTVQDGKLYISGVVDDAATVKNGIGTLATVSFRGLKAGTATLSFLCETGRTDDSNVSKNDTDATDLLVCTSLVDASYTLSGATVNPDGAAVDGTVTDGTAADGSTTGTTDTSHLGSTTTDGTIPATGFMDVFKIMPKILMGFLFIAIGLIPLLI